MRFLEAVKVKIGGCKKCYTATYSLPAKIDKSIENYFVSYGKQLYKLDTIKLFRINGGDGFNIDAQIGTKTIKLIMPKKFSKIEVKDIKRKNEFEACLAAWLTDVLGIEIKV